jgi:hypothetical protein
LFIESLLAALSAIFSYIIGTRFTDGRRYIYVHDEFSNLVQVKHTSLEKVQLKKRKKEKKRHA